jgi:hypothetical protein
VKSILAFNKNIILVCPVSLLQRFRGNGRRLLNGLYQYAYSRTEFETCDLCRSAAVKGYR